MTINIAFEQAEGMSGEKIAISFVARNLDAGRAFYDCPVASKRRAGNASWLLSAPAQ